MEEKSDLVWAKLKYCPFWPARIVNAPPELGKIPKDKICVLFFGSNNFGFVHEQYVVDYVQHRDKYAKKGRGNEFKEAVARMDEFIRDPEKFAKNSTAKPINKTVTIKRERAPIVKKENGIESSPFETTTVYCGTQNKTDLLDTEIASLKADKTRLVEELITMKTENQKLYFEVKSKEQAIETHEIDLNRLQQKLSEQQKTIAQLTRENQVSKAKMRQLMLSASAGHMNKHQDLENEPEEYEVEDILDHSGKKGKRKFLIRWKDFPPSYDTWESESNLNCDEILKKYLKTKGL